MFDIKGRRVMRIGYVVRDIENVKGLIVESPQVLQMNPCQRYFRYFLSYSLNIVKNWSCAGLVRNSSCLLNQAV
jgi:hypothetical protein